MKLDKNTYKNYIKNIYSNTLDIVIEDVIGSFDDNVFTNDYVRENEFFFRTAIDRRIQSSLFTDLKLKESHNELIKEILKYEETPIFKEIHSSIVLDKENFS